LYDGGTGGLSLLSQLWGKDYLFILDAVLLGESPGTVARFTYDAVPPNYQRRDTAHGIDMLDLLAVAETLECLPHTMILGIQPADITTPGLELTPLVRERMDDLIELLLKELERLGITPGEKISGESTVGSDR
jgi:hydrogenase maturation protease